MSLYARRDAYLTAWQHSYEAWTGKAIEVVDEYWYSPELSIYMIIRHSDPRTGEQLVAVQKVERAEPPAEVFAVPASYKVVDETPPEPTARRSHPDAAYELICPNGRESKDSKPYITANSTSVEATCPSAYMSQNTLSMAATGTNTPWTSASFRRAQPGIAGTTKSRIAMSSSNNPDVRAAQTTSVVYPTEHLF